jgi:hypothetical protein
LLANTFGGKEEDYKELQFQYLQKDISENQHHNLKNLVKVLNQKPDLGIEFLQINNKEEEIENLALFKTKKEYFRITTDSVTEEQYNLIMKLSNKDSLFVYWVDKKIRPQAYTSIQEKCVRYIGKDQLNQEVQQLMEQRNTSLLTYFAKKGIPTDRIKITNSKDDKKQAKKTIPRYVINFFAKDEADTTKTASAKPPQPLKQ